MKMNKLSIINILMFVTIFSCYALEGASITTKLSTVLGTYLAGGIMATLLLLLRYISGKAKYTNESEIEKLDWHFAFFNLYLCFLLFGGFRLAVLFCKNPAEQYAVFLTLASLSVLGFICFEVSRQLEKIINERKKGNLK